MDTPGTIKKWVLGVIFVLVMSPLLGTVYTYTRAGEGARVHAATASTLNFQARLMGSNGALVSDGSYSIQFKLYDAVTGGTNEWTETQTVTAKNGYFSSYLGTVTPFAGTIDWSQEKWLTMNVNGDGEMTPRIKLTAVPYALRSGQADSLTVTGGTITGDNLLQKAPGTIQGLSSSNAGLRFNQTGAGGLIQLQGDGVTVFTVDKTGNAALSGGLTLGGSTSTTAGTLRWNGSDFEGYNGTSWVSLTATGGTTAFTQGGNTLGEDAVLGTTDNYALRFITNNTEKFTILANGNVGVGDTTPSALFTVGTADALTITASGNLTTAGTITSAGLVTANGGLNINLGGTPGLLKVDASGNVGLATSGSDYEQPLSFANGLTRTGNSVVLGGALTGNTTIDMASFNLTFNNGGTLNIGATTTPFASKLNIGGNLVTTSTSYNVFSANSNLNAYGYFRAVDTSDTVGRFELGAYDFNGASQGGRDLVLNPLGGNVGVGGDLTPDGLFSVGSSSQFQVNGSGAITAATSGNTINGLIINSGALSGVTTLNMSGGITAATTNTINSLNINAGNVSGLTGLTFTSGGINLNNGGITNAGALSGITTLQAASGKFNIDANGGVTSGFTQLNGLTTATSASGLNPGTINVGAGNTANFDVGNYVLVNGTYAKITAKTTSALSITPNLTWSAGATVTEYYIPELGGSNTSSPLTSRFGRGYFIAGVATGNGTTYYNEDGITTTLGTFNIANENATVLNIGGAATNITLGTSTTTVNVAGNLQTAANQTITAGGGLTVSSGGISNNGGGITGTGALAGVTTISASGSITAATSNTINGLSINAGALSGITGFGQTSGNFSVTGSGSITLGAGSNALTINSTNFDVSSAGALSGITTLSMSGAITAATTTNTINGLIINSGALSGITGLTFTSGGLNLNGGGITNAGSVGGITGLTFISGNLALGGGNITGVSSLTATTVNAGTVTNAGILNLTATGAGNDVAVTAADQIQLNAGTTIELQDNTNVTGSLNITGGITATNSVKFTTGGANPAYAEGLLFYDTTQKALSYYNSEADITMNIGQEDYIYVYNNTGATITDGQAVYISGANAGVPTVALGRADALTTAQAVGVTTHSIENGTYGFVTRFGEINNLNTSTFVSGDTLYLSATTAGQLTNVRPSQPNFTNAIARVTEVNATTGKIMVLVGDTRAGALTTGSIAFGGSDGFSREDNANFFWDNTNKRLGIGDNTPAATLTVGNGDLFQVAGATGNVLTSGTITAATSNTINGLSINAGSLSGVTGFGQTSGNFSVTGTGSITLGGGSNALTINSTAFDVSATGALSGITTLSLSGAITGATSINTINGLIINAGSLGGITGFTQTSGNFAMSGTGTFSTGTGAVSLNGAVTTASTLQTTGNITLNSTTGAYRILRSGTTYTGIDVNCGNNQYMNSINVRGGIVTSYSACSGVGLSDQRLKTNIVGLEGSVLDSLKDIQTVTFDFDCTNSYFSSTNTSCDTKNQTGVLAQQLETVLPGLVYSDEYGYKHVNYEGLSIYTLRGVSELSKYLNSQGNANLNTISTGGTLRLTASGALQNITGLTLSSGGASIVGGLNNNNSGITAVGSITGATTISAQSLALDAGGDQNLLTLKKDGNGVFTVFNNGALELKLDSSNAFTVKGANGDNALNIDTLTGKVKIGAGNNGKTVLFVLDTKSSNGDPAGVNGAQYYNSAMKKFRCYQNDKWQDCLQTAFSEYTIASGGSPWVQPSGDHELPGENRTWIDLGNANQARLLINISAAGNQGASCKLQYSLTEDNPVWHDLTDSGTTTIDRTGAVKGDWLQIKNEAKGEVLVRVYCSGGNNTSTMTYSSIRTQVR